ncbi:MAG: hypothetical protein K9I99_09900, partial [Melioribacteraceae bacterium]|nr:hypothetical protein [Melioribacteraceae bacterium]
MLGVAKSINSVGKTLKKLRFDVLLNRVGRSPGTLIYTGRKEEKEFRIKFTKYNQESVETTVVENKLELLKLLADLDDKYNYWLDLNFLNDIELLKSIGALFGVNSLVLEDILNINHRPKIEFFDEFVFSIVKIISISDDEKIEFDQLAFLVFDNLLITFHESNAEEFAPIYSRLAIPQTVMRKFGSEYMFFAILDYIIDLYSVVNYRLMENLEKLQTTIFENPVKEQLIEIDNLRRRIHETKRFMVPVKDLVNKVLRTEEGFKFVQIKIYFQDALDHMEEVNMDIEQMII